MQRFGQFRSLLPLVAAALLVVPAALALPGTGQHRFWDAAGGMGGIVTVSSTYLERTEGGLVDQFMDVNLILMPADNAFRILINDHEIGRIMTGPGGGGTLLMRRMDVQPGPDGRPPDPKRIDTNDILRVISVDMSLGIDISAPYRPR
ncbi:MAG: hypothetical protein EYC70_04975 [Planctomycetota bacterium]|nr:MAG: hypothetical protein EYC70_04975 [Planctomycetota bacterium]